MKSSKGVGERLARIGPVPFLLVGVLLLVAGVVLQFSLGASQSSVFAGFPTIFGLFAKIGGAVILFGLVIFALKSDPNAPRHGEVPEELPMSARGPKPKG